LIEMVMVITIIAIVAATVTLSITSQTRNYVISETDKLRRGLSHVQALAAGWGARLRVTTSSSGYSVTCRTALGRSPCNAIGDAVTDPATGSSFSVTLSSGVSLSQSGGTSSTTLDFDSLGRPVGTSSLLSSSTVYTLSGNNRTATVTVLPITGFASASY
jgi:type II secretory pathway pseudopilin PulG